MAGFWDALLAGVSAAEKAYKQPKDVTTTSLDPAVEALATDATLVAGVTSLIIDAYPITAPFAPLINAGVHSALQALIGAVSNGVKSGALVDVGSAVVSKSWVEDTSHWLNADGSFMNAAQIAAANKGKSK